MHSNYLDFLHNALSHRPTPNANSSGFWSISKCQNFKPNPYPSLEDRIMALATQNASNVSNFNRLMRSILFHLNLLGKSSFTYSCACQAKVPISAESKLQDYWTLEVFTGVPRLKSSYVSIYKFQPLHFVTCNFGEVFTTKGGNFA